MHHETARRHALADLDTTTIQSWLATARARGYTSAVLSLELELSARGVFDDAAHEPAFPLSYVADRERRRVIARTRLSSASAAQSVDAFHASLHDLDPANFTDAWLLARGFAHAGARAEALIHVAFWIACFFKGPEEAGAFIAGKTADKTPEEIIAALEAQFGTLFDRAGGVSA
jgi:hypothetical protein